MGRPGKEEKKPVKDRWDSQVKYVWSLIVCTVSMNNFWEFPFYMNQYGGCSFLLAYVVMHLTFGIPLITMQLALGQFSSCGAVLCWQFSRLFQGVGISYMLLLIVYSFFLIIVSSWTINYLVRSFFEFDAWKKCVPEFASEECLDFVPLRNESDCFKSNWTLRGGACYKNVSGREQIAALWNYSEARRDGNIRRHLPAEDYMLNDVIGHKAGKEGLGEIQWDMLLSVACCLLIVSLITISSLRTLNKVMQVLMAYVYIYCIFFLIVGLCLEGSKDGMAYLLSRTDLARLQDLSLWGHAGFFVMNDLLVNFGVLESLASYSDFKGDVCLHAVVTSVVNVLTSVVLFVGILGFLGYLAKHREMPIEEMIISGPTLVFATLPSAIDLLPGAFARVMMVLYFLLVFFISISTVMYMVLVLVCNIVDVMTELRVYKKYVIAGMCGLAFLLCIPLTMEGGYNIASSMILSWKSPFNFNMFFMVLLEVVAVVWAYGYQQFTRDIENMVGGYVLLGRVPWFFYKCWLSFCWVYVCVITLFLVLSVSTTSTYKPSYGWEMIALQAASNVITFLPVPLNLMWRLIRKRSIVQYSLWQRFLLLTLPSERWGPALPKQRRKWMAMFTGRLRRVRSSEIVDEDEMMEREEQSLDIELELLSDSALRKQLSDFLLHSKEHSRGSRSTDGSQSHVPTFTSAFPGNKSLHDSRSVCEIDMGIRVDNPLLDTSEKMSAHEHNTLNTTSTHTLDTLKKTSSHSIPLSVNKSSSKESGFQTLGV